MQRYIVYYIQNYYIILFMYIRVNACACYFNTNICNVATYAVDTIYSYM